MDVSIVMACKNSDKTQLLRAIKSVLCQSLRDFEFIIVDDGSNEHVEDMISDIQDARLRIYRIENSHGLGDALNFGISKAKGEFIARFDDDDIMDIDRIRIQRDFLALKTNVVCVGSQIYLLYNNKIAPYRKFPTSNACILDDLVRLKFSIAHTAVMFRKEVFKNMGGYRIKGGGQDLDLFFQFSKYGELANIPQCLTCYSLSMSGLSVVNEKKKEAYLFALRSISVVEDKKYLPLKKNILNSIKMLESTGSHSANKLKRNWLIIYVSLFGRKLK